MIDTKSYLSCAAHHFWSKRILNERQQPICIKIQSAQMIKYDVLVAYLVLCVKGWETGLVSLAKLKIDKDGIHSVDRIPFSTSFHLI